MPRASPSQTDRTPCRSQLESWTGGNISPILPRQASFWINRFAKMGMQKSGFVRAITVRVFPSGTILQWAVQMGEPKIQPLFDGRIRTFRSLCDIVDSWKFPNSMNIYVRMSRVGENRTLLDGLNFIGLRIWNLNCKLLPCILSSRKCEITQTKATPTSSTAITTSTASRLSRPRSFVKEEAVVS